jgi:hypothetical protein
MFIGLCLFNLIHAVNPIKLTAANHINASPLSDNIESLLVVGTGRVIGTTVVTADAREILLSGFLKNSPLAPYAGLIISEADKYGLDFRLVPAIAMCESNLGKRIPSSDSYNAFGIAVYTGQQEGAKFVNWEKSISWVYEFIHEKFISRDIVDIREIGSIWAPPSVENGHSWANCVETFMNRIR